MLDTVPPSNTIATAMTTSSSSLWIFGYGSLIWNPGFKYAVAKRARARGYARRMYQGNMHHRGDASLPGRVATLVPHATSSAVGLVFRVDGQDAIRRALEHLEQREVDNGYELALVLVQTDEETTTATDEPRQVLALTCIAHAHNSLYLGRSSVGRMAAEIAKAHGCAGPNHEYVLRLADVHRRLFPAPQDRDPHLDRLAKLVRRRLRANSV